MKLTIYIPNYNNKSNIIKSIDSCYYINLPKSEYEIIVIDNNSTDGSAELLQKILLDPNYSNLTVVLNDKNIGRVSNWNLCLKNGSGKFIIFLFSNEKFSPDNNISELLDLMELRSISLVKYSVCYLSGMRDFLNIFGDRDINSFFIFLVKFLTLAELPFNPLQSFIFLRQIVSDDALLFDEYLDIVADQDFIIRYLVSSFGDFIHSKIFISHSCNIIFDDTSLTRRHASLNLDVNVCSAFNWYKSHHIYCYTHFPLWLFRYLLICKVTYSGILMCFRFNYSEHNMICDARKKLVYSNFIIDIICFVFSFLFNPYFFTAPCFALFRLGRKFCSYVYRF